MESAPSRTAMFAAVSRGLFRLETASPWVLDDVLALVLVGPVWRELRDQFDPLFPSPVRRESRAAVCTRSRYAEDRLAAGAFTQYVILGAGLDSLAWRRPDLVGSLAEFPVGYPASHALELVRVMEHGLPPGGVGEGMRRFLHADRGFCRRASSAWLAGIRDREADQPVRAKGRGPPRTCRPAAAVLRRPYRWPAALYIRDLGGRAGHLSGRRPRRQLHRLRGPG